ncbi:MAG: DUF211 domain-containing protein [Gammaproteobacteria bacterium]|nr:DUF211 domain-containing protein [Gammaproteobacteria bacterium]
MGLVKRLVVDVLKPHQPSSIEFSQAIARVGVDYKVRLTVVEMDEKTETLEVVIEGNDIDFAAIKSTISDMGGSLHSIDEVEVHSEADAG